MMRRKASPPRGHEEYGKLEGALAMSCQAFQKHKLHEFPNDAMKSQVKENLSFSLSPESFIVCDLLHLVALVKQSLKKLLLITTTATTQTDQPTE